MKEVLLLKENEEMALRSLRKALSRQFNLVDFCLFGSKVRGEALPESDLDVMIEIEESTFDIESQIDDIIFDVNLKNDCFMSAIIFGKKEIEEGPLGESPIYKTIAKEGVHI